MVRHEWQWKAEPKTVSVPSENSDPERVLNEHRASPSILIPVDVSDLNNLDSALSIEVPPPPRGTTSHARQSTAIAAQERDLELGLLPPLAPSGVLRHQYLIRQLYYYRSCFSRMTVLSQFQHFSRSHCHTIEITDPFISSCLRCDHFVVASCWTSNLLVLFQILELSNLP